LRAGQSHAHPSAVVATMAEHEGNMTRENAIWVTAGAFGVAVVAASSLWRETHRAGIPFFSHAAVDYLTPWLQISGGLVALILVVAAVMWIRGR
jgi:hypothetical protein